MVYPQGNFYPQGAFSAQSFQNPQGSLYPQQGSFYPQGTFGQQAFQSNPFQSNLGNIPFANTLYGYPQQLGYPQQAGYPQQTPNFAQGLPQSSNWQQPAQQQAALQQHAIQQLLAHQLAAQQLGMQQPSPMNAFPGLSNGAVQPVGAWTQQPNAEQINPALTPRHHLLQQLAQYHYLVAQQLAQLAAQQAVQGSITPYAGQYIPGGSQFIPGAGQFIPGQLAGNFAPGITMH
jgi:hypothetical protein